LNTLMLSGSGNSLNELNVYDTFVTKIVYEWAIPTAKSYYINI
jgi:hypothetical protein